MKKNNYQSFKIVVEFQTPHPRTAIEAEILFAAHIMHLWFLKLVRGKTPREQNSSGKKIGAESAVPILVYFYIILIVHKYRQSAKESFLLKRNTLPEVFPLTIGSGKTMPFEKRRSSYKETAENKAEAYRVYGEHLFSACDAVDARIFSKGDGNMTRKASTTNLPGARGNAYPNAELDYSLDYEYDPAYAHRLVHAGNRYYRYDANGNITAEKDGPFTEDDEFIFTYNYDPDTDVYGTDYGFGLDAPKETEESHPENLFAYRRNYTWNEKNQLTKSSDRSYTVHYRYGEDGQRAFKYTEEGRSETLYFNNFYTIHIPVQDKNNPQGLRVHKHIFVGNSRLVTAMTHTDNNGDNAEQREKRYYYHSDHLGSAQFVTDWRGRQYEHIEYTPYGELWIEEVAAGLDKLPFRFTGKEMDEETGLYYYGARYLDPKYSRWLSGDPALNDYIPKAPIDDEAKKHNENLPGMGGVYNIVNMHLYHYAGNNPVKYTDPDGKIVIAPAVVWGINATLFGYGVVASRNDEIGFAARHPIIAVQLGLPKDGGRHGINSAASNFAINSGLSKFAFTGASQDLGSKKGAYRHAVWQAIICSKFGENIATEVGNSHETVSPEKQASYTSLIDADTYCDQMNNIIGRSLGKDSNLSNKELALKALDIFHDSGLYTVSQNKDGSYSVGITKINDSEYNTAYSEILKRNNQGLLE